MTICASVKVRDGLVIATDSMTQIHVHTDEGQSGVVNTYSNATKLFHIVEAPIGVMSYGIGNINQRSIQGLMRDFTPSDDTNMESVSEDLFGFFNTEYNNAYIQLENKPVLGFYLAGYTQEEEFPEEWEFRFPRDNNPTKVRENNIFGASWRGIELPFSRLYKGYDPRLPNDLRDAGLTDSTVGTVRSILQNYESRVVYDGMPVQDAINFATYILRTTIGLATYEIGPPSCGGPLQLATILPDEGFKWIAKPLLTIENI